ncbi:hypothetical protein D5F51_09565 [Yersinia hibernica]|uniref:Uncharacterized protein n=2 Tax=Yersinia hibernica TaxID=2339259 RepID=A0ABX5R0H9_9GAMM|nr:hypothetical protein D5F51_09565 [Yersinia hibernica]
MMKRNFISLSFICVITLSTPLKAGADFSYHAEAPNNSKVSKDYLEKRKALGSTGVDAQSWQRQLDAEKARIDAEAVRRENEKQQKCQQQQQQQRPRTDNASNSYLVPDPCADHIGIDIPIY